MEQKIMEGNKIIAEFMGGIYSENAAAWGFGNARIEHKEFVFEGKLYKNLVWAERFEKELKYHSSWDWLMPIIGKIACLGRSNFEDKINRKRVELFKDVSIFSTIQNVYSIVIEFIIWYNETNK